MRRNTIVAFRIYYKDGKTRQGQAPFRSNEEEHFLEAMKQFVIFFFAGPPEKYNRIDVEIVKDFGTDEDVWIQNVYTMDSYRDMYRFHGYGGELILKHNLTGYFKEPGN